jgi:histidinol phosphatase-like PHP family hydrolase
VKRSARVPKTARRKTPPARPQPLTNARIAELLAREGDTAKPPLNKAFRRASRRAFLWSEEAYQSFRQDRPLTELPGIGPYLEKIVRRWFEKPPAPFDPPPLRSNFMTWMEVEAVLATSATWLASLKGDLQMHSTWSDGSGSVQEMADAAIERNYEYIAITDHSKGLKIAGGIDEGQLAEQAAEIEGVNRSLKVAGRKLTVLRSIELNLNPQGEGDMQDSALARLDIVLGCFHSSLRRKEDQTGRYLAALHNPSIQILGHTRGRIYNYRMGLTADWSRVFDTAAELDKAVEIDAYPDRQDLSGDLLPLAKKAGCRISFGTDSHGPSQLAYIGFSAASALRAGIRADRILNFMSCRDLLNWVTGVREAANSVQSKG